MTVETYKCWDLDNETVSSAKEIQSNHRNAAACAFVTTLKMEKVDEESCTVPVGVMSSIGEVWHLQVSCESVRQTVVVDSVKAPSAEFEAGRQAGIAEVRECNTAENLLLVHRDGAHAYRAALLQHLNSQITTGDNSLILAMIQEVATFKGPGKEE